MSGISTGTGLFSGIDSRSIIDQLIAIESRPKVLAQQRINSLQQQRAAFLDINSRLNTLKTAAGAFRIDRIFDAKTATSSNDDVMTATAGLGAANGTYSFRVERLVTTQQNISRGFADRNSSGMGLTQISIESARARLDSTTTLSELNDGAGVQRGRIVVTDSAGRAATVDLSKAVTVEDVVSAINSNGTAQVTASVRDGAFVLKDNAGGALTVANGAGYTTATSLGLTTGTQSAGTLTGARVFGLNANTALASLNDGNGVFVKFNATSSSFANFNIVVDGTTVGVNLSDVYTIPQGGGASVKTGSAVSTVGGALQRINDALTAANYSEVRASVNATTGRIELTDSLNRTIEITEVDGGTTGRDLGLSGNGVGSLQGRRVLAGMNTMLATSLNGGSGITGDGALSFTLRSGAAFSTTIDTTKSLADILGDIEAASATTPGGPARVRASLDSKGTGIVLTDLTTGTGNLIITGTTGADSATSLKITTGPTGVASSTVSSGNLQKQYMSTSTLLEKLNNGRGVGTGKFRITDGSGQTALIDIAADSKTLGDIVNEINAATSTTGSTGGGAGSPLTVRARINANGDGIELYDTGTGGTRIKVEDTTGTVAKNLNIAGTATGVGVGADNKINGSFEKVVALLAGDTLNDVVRKINEAGADATAAVISDGAGATPFRLALTSKISGRDGRFIVDTGSVDLGLSQLAAGENALAFFGAGDVASSIAVSSSSNIIDDILPGVKIDLKGTSQNVINLNITSDNGKLTESVNKFIEAFNGVIDRINTQTKYDKDTNRRSPLTGDGTAIELKSGLSRVVQQRAESVTGRYQRLVDIGIKVGKDSKLEFDADKFGEAMATDPESVEALLTARTLSGGSTTELEPGVSVNNPNFGNEFSSLGAMGQVERLVDRYVNSIGGVLTQRNNGIQRQVDLQTSRISLIDVRLARRREVLERQFAAMESTVGRLQQQGASLGSLGR